MLHLHKPPSQQSSFFSLRGCASIIGGCLIAALLVAISMNNHRVVQLPEAKLEGLVQKYSSRSTPQVLASQIPPEIAAPETETKIASAPAPTETSTANDVVEMNLPTATLTEVTAEPSREDPPEVPVVRPAPVKPKFPIHIGPTRTTVQAAPVPPAIASDIPASETQSTSAAPSETKPPENSSEQISVTDSAELTSPLNQERPPIASDATLADSSPQVIETPSLPPAASIPPSAPPTLSSPSTPTQAFEQPPKIRDSGAWTPSIVPSHCLCTNMFTRHNAQPFGFRYELLPAPDAVMKNDSFTLPTYYSSDNTGDAAMNDPRWRQYMYYEECGMMLPRDVLLHKVPPTVGKEFDLQLPTCLLQDIWLNVPDLSKQYDSAASSASSASANGIPQGRGAAALALAMQNPNVNKLTAETPRALTPPLMSIELVVFNQAEYITQVLMPILHLTRHPFELVIFFDTADDESIQIVQGILHAVYQHCDMDAEYSSAVDWEFFPMKSYIPHEGYRFGSPLRGGSNWHCLNPYLVHVRTLFQPTPLFETASNNVQFRASHPHSKYYISVQDDQPMEVLGWNELLTKPFEWYDDVIGVSARCAHGFYTDRHMNVDAGRCGHDVFHPLDGTIWDPQRRCAFYVRDTANRGPLALHAERLKTMGYLDEQHIRLDGDDHDLFARSYAAEKWKAGFLPLEWNSDPNRGGMRKYKRPPTEKELLWKDYRARYALTSPLGLEVVRKRAMMENWTNHNGNRLPPPNALKYCLVKPEGRQDFDANGNVVFFTKQWWQEQEDSNRNNNIPE